MRQVIDFIVLVSIFVTAGLIIGASLAVFGIWATIFIASLMAYISYYAALDLAAMLGRVFG